MTSAEAWFNKSLRPRKPEGSLGRTAQDGRFDSHTAPELCEGFCPKTFFSFGFSSLIRGGGGGEIGGRGGGGSSSSFPLVGCFGLNITVMADWSLNTNFLLSV